VAMKAKDNVKATEYSSALNIGNENWGRNYELERNGTKT
jgi:hypothetical protein